MAGVDVFRLNFSHGAHEEKAQVDKKLFSAVLLTFVAASISVRLACCTYSGGIDLMKGGTHTHTF